jgi:hypothetical protein
LTLKFDQPDSLIVAGNVTGFDGILYRSSVASVVRDGQGHISGFSGSASILVDDPVTKAVQAGLDYGPGDVLFYARSIGSAGDVAQVKLGSSATDKSGVVGLNGLEAIGLQFVPPGFPGEGQLKVRTRNGEFVTLALSPDAAGTFDLTAGPPVSFGGPANGGIAYVPPGSPGFADHGAVLLSSFSQGTIEAWQLDTNGDPEAGTGVLFASELSGPWGMTFDGSTGDLLIAIYGSCNILSVRGFGTSVVNTPTPTNTQSATVAPTETPTPTGTPGFLTITGTCRVPGPKGLEPCPAGVAVTASFCSDASCDVLGEVGGTTTDGEGTFTIGVDDSDVAGARLIIAAEVGGGDTTTGGAQAGTTYRVLSFGPIAGGRLAVELSPVSNAALQLLEENGLANYGDGRAMGVNDAVAEANATTNFAGDSLQGAVGRARDTATSDPTVQARLACPTDCNLDRSVSVAELITAVNRALRTLPQGVCEAADGNGDGNVSIDEMVDGVSRSIGECFKE